MSLARSLPANTCFYTPAIKSYLLIEKLITLIFLRLETKIGILIFSLMTALRFFRYSALPQA